MSFDFQKIRKILINQWKIGEKTKTKKNAINEEKNPEISSVGYIHPHFVLGSINTRNIEDIIVIYLDILNSGHDFSKLLSCMSSHT